MTQNQKKIIWTLLAVTVTGLAAYSIFVHDSEHSKFGCPFCSIRNSSGMVGFITGCCIVGAVYNWKKK